MSENNCEWFVNYGHRVNYENRRYRFKKNDDSLVIHSMKTPVTMVTDPSEGLIGACNAIIAKLSSKTVKKVAEVVTEVSAPAPVVKGSAKKAKRVMDIPAPVIEEPGLL
jgi:uncharacterized protein YtpQ (UPF0354 family)